MSDRIILCDVAPRDGIQNEKIMLSSAHKLELIRRLAAAGMPKWVPQMADAEEVFREAAKIPAIRPIVLVLNDRGYDRAVAAGARYIRLVVAAYGLILPSEVLAWPRFGCRYLSERGA